MDFVDKLMALSATIPRVREHLNTEEATKTALVMPFIQALGYNVFDPTEVTPELTADVGTKKGEKVDYAIIKDGGPIILFECKMIGADLGRQHASQLYRYFTVTKARFGVLTDGVRYRFFTDLDEPNKMDARPFLEFSLLDIRESQVEEIKKFTKAAFVVDAILATASDLKYTREIKRVLAEDYNEPSEPFVRYLASRVYDGRMTQAVLVQFTEMVSRGFQQFVGERLSDRLKSALDGDVDPTVVQVAPARPAVDVDEPSTPALGDDSIITTAEELEGYMLVKAMLRGVVDVRRVAMRDAKSYCAVLLDDNNRKPICRLHFNGVNKRHIGLFDEAKQETRVELIDLDQMLDHADAIRETVSRYL